MSNQSISCITILLAIIIASGCSEKPMQSNQPHESESIQRSASEDSVASSTKLRNDGGNEDTKSSLSTKNPAIRRYIDNKDGTVTDSVSGLQWMRCRIGQTWTNNSCKGNPKIFEKFSDINNFAESHPSILGYNDWRIPKIQEIVSLWYCSNDENHLNEAKEIELNNNRKAMARPNICVGKYNFNEPHVLVTVFPTFRGPLVGENFMPSLDSQIWSATKSGFDNDDSYYWVVNFGQGLIANNFHEFRSGGGGALLVRSPH